MIIILILIKIMIVIMEILINGKHIQKDEHIDVLNPYDNSLVDTVPIADKNDVNYVLFGKIYYFVK